LHLLEHVFKHIDQLNFGVLSFLDLLSHLVAQLGNVAREVLRQFLVHSFALSYLLLHLLFKAREIGPNALLDNFNRLLSRLLFLLKVSLQLLFSFIESLLYSLHNIFTVTGYRVESFLQKLLSLGELTSSLIEKGSLCFPLAFEELHHLSQLSIGLIKLLLRVIEHFLKDVLDLADLALELAGFALFVVCDVHLDLVNLVLDSRDSISQVNRGLLRVLVN